jgi:hypothetical protein
MRIFIGVILVGSLLGCSSEVPRKAAPVNVSGKVSQSGQPIGGVVMVFQPLGDGHMREFPIGKDGSFSGELITGDYAYYISRPAVPAAARLASKLPPQYFQADLSRVVTVEPDKQLAIALD